MANEPAPDNERTDAVLLTKADGTQEHVAIPDELKIANVVQVELTAETIEAIARAIKRHR